MPKPALWGLVVVGAAFALVVAGFFGLYFVRPRLILRDLMWTHTPPFGRVSATFHYAQNRVIEVKTHDLD